MKRISTFTAALLFSALSVAAAQAAGEGTTVVPPAKGEVKIGAARQVLTAPARGRQSSEVKKRAAEMKRKQMEQANVGQGQ